MRREPPDSRFYAEIRDLNLAFLELVVSGRHRPHAPVFGLDLAIVDQVSRFSPGQLGEMAATPCLLAGFASARTARFPQRVAEPPPAADAEWVGQAGLFAAGLLTYVWQMGRRDALRAALCGAGTAAAQGDELSFMRIRGLAARAAQHIEARFSGRTRFWPDLVRAVRDGQPEGIRLARLTAIQLATSEYRANFDPPPSLYKPRVGSSPAGMR